MTRKRSAPAAPTCSSSSSSSTVINGDSPPQIQSDTTKPKPKRARKNNAGSTTSGARSSIYRGVTRHRWTGRYEAHLWNKNSWNSISKKKGKQVYLGAYDCEDAAAHTYDLAALKYWGPGTILNFPIETYTKELEEMQKASREEYLATLRRNSSGFSRGVSKYRGVARHHHNGRWEARIGRVYGNKYLYLGTYNTQEEAAEAYDMAALEYKGSNAVTNFNTSNYIDRLRMKGIELAVSQNSSNESEQPPQQQQEAETEAEVEQQPQQQQQQQPEQHNVQKQEEQILPEYTHFMNKPPPSPSMDDSTMYHGLDWSFCMDLTTGFPDEFTFSDFSLPKTSSGNDLQGLKFNDISFEDNIGFMFDSIFAMPTYGSEAMLSELDSPSILTPDEVVGSRGGGPTLGKIEEDKEDVNNGKVRLMCVSSPSSSITSTTTSISNYSYLV